MSHFTRSIGCVFAVAFAIFAAAPAGAFPPTGPYTGRLDIGEAHTCALQLDGSVDCWGWNHRGQATDHPGPFVEIASGSFHNCGLYADGSAECWGDGGDGQTAPQPGTFLQIAPGDSFTCGLRPNHEVECWGKNNLGQASPKPGPFDQIESGGNHACGYRNDGSMECWGYDGFGQLAGLSPGPQLDAKVGNAHNCVLASDGSASCWGYNLWGQADPRPGPFVQIEPGFTNTCALDALGDVTCWGNAFAEVPESVPGPFVQIFGRINHFCGIRPDESLACWGYNFFGQADPRAKPFGTLFTIETTLERATAWRSSSKPGRIRADGTVRVEGGPYEKEDLTVTVRDGQDLEEVGTFTSCTEFSSGTVRCENADRTARIRYVPSRTDPGLYAYRLDLRRRDITAPQVAPLEVEFALEGSTGTAKNEPCRSHRAKLVCKGASIPTAP